MQAALSPAGWEGEGASRAVPFAVAWRADRDETGCQA